MIKTQGLTLFQWQPFSFRDKTRVVYMSFFPFFTKKGVVYMLGSFFRYQAT